VPAIASLGYRPFFLLGTLWAAIAITVWLHALAGAPAPPSHLDPLAWHVHELVYGYLPAIAAGFLLTAVPNWTERPPLTGTPLLLLAALWLAGRVAIACSTAIGTVAAAIVDCAFLFALMAIVAHAIVASRDWEDAGVVALLGILAAGNVTFHLESSSGGFGARIGIGAGVALITLIGGRIVPAFTRNWLRARGVPGRLPSEFDRFDGLAIAAGLAALALWIARPHAAATAVACAAAALLHTVRLARWAGERTGAEILVLVLHVGYAFVPLGFAAVAIAHVAPTAIAASAALHAWTAGAIGVMTLAVMTRATLGHSGRDLHAGAATQLIYAAIVFAALSRIASGVAGAPTWLLHASGGAWIAAFAGFVAAYGRMLLTPRQDTP
jgi:uncharacterized protein involved in response to NO